MMAPKIKSYILAHLRRIFHWSPAYRATKSRAHVTSQVYICEGCHCYIDKKGKSGVEYLEGETVFAENMHVDHIEPVIPLEGFSSDEEFKAQIIPRMFVEAPKLQYLCESCHYIKTQIENDIRRRYINEQ